MAKDKIDPSIPEAPEAEQQIDSPALGSDPGKLDPAIPKAPKSEPDDEEESA